MLDCNSAMTWACKETRAKCGSRQPEGFSSGFTGCRMGQHVPRQGRGRISTYPGQLPQKGPKILHIKASMLLCKPRGASSRGGGALSKDQSYQNPSGIFLLGTESLQTEVPAWRC